MLKISLIPAAAALVAAAVIPSLAGAQETPFSVRLGVTNLQPANKSDAFSTVPADAIHVTSKTLPEIDLYYTFTPNIVAELVLTYPQSHDVTLSGTNIGSFKELPPTLLGLYHFLPKQQFDPYVGVGLNFTWITDVHLASETLDLKKSSFGAALDVGVDYNVDKRWFVNADIKYITPLQSDVTAGGNKVTTVKVDPFLYSIGVGYHF